MFELAVKLEDRVVEIRDDGARVLEKADVDVGEYVRRHLDGDWGELDADEWRENDRALENGHRGGCVYSVFRLESGDYLVVVSRCSSDRGKRVVSVYGVEVGGREEFLLCRPSMREG